MPTEPIFYYKSTCSTCRRARALLQELGVSTRERDMSKQPLSLDELRALVGDREIKPFLNPRNELYRERGMARQTPTKDEALALMAENPNLIRRPILIVGGSPLLGFDEEAYRRALDAS
jgi:Spx/MgsR family transcriptional regulator